MANAGKGEVSLQINETTYTLVLTLDAMVALEEMFGTPEKPVFFPEIAALAEKGSTKHARALFWALFQEHHADVQLTQVSKLVQAAGGIVALGETLTKVMASTEPDKKDLDTLGVKKNPQSAQAAKARTNGTGERSTSGRDALA